MTHGRLTGDPGGEPRLARRVRGGGVRHAGHRYTQGG